MQFPEVSIIVPVYNSEKYLSRSIESILAQTFINFECILIDDGSIDGSLSICEHYRQSDDRIVVIHQENSGVSATRNKGIDLARGKYICFIDSDDYAQENLCEKLVSAMKSTNADVACCGYNENDKVFTICNEDFILSNKSTIEIIHFLEMKQALGLVWNKIYRKDILDTYRTRFSYELKFGEDMVFNLQYFRYVNTVYISSNCLYNYLHDNQNALTKGKMTFEEMNFRFETVSNSFREFDNNAKSIFYAELLAKDFIYTIALLLRLYAEKKGIEEKLIVINKLKIFYKENRAKNKFRTKAVAITYKMLLYTPSKLFGRIFSLLFLTYMVLADTGKGKSRFVES